MEIFPRYKKREKEIITQTRIGFSHLTHAYLISKGPAPICDKCNVTLLIEHGIINCLKYIEARQILKNLTSLQKARPIETQQQSTNPCIK